MALETHWAQITSDVPPRLPAVISNACPLSITLSLLEQADSFSLPYRLREKAVSLFLATGVHQILANRFCGPISQGSPPSLFVGLEVHHRPAARVEPQWHQAVGRTNVPLRFCFSFEYITCSFPPPASQSSSLSVIPRGSYISVNLVQRRIIQRLDDSLWGLPGGFPLLALLGSLWGCRNSLDCSVSFIRFWSKVIGWSGQRGCWGHPGQTSQQLRHWVRHEEIPHHLHPEHEHCPGPRDGPVQ